MQRWSLKIRKQIWSKRQNREQEGNGDPQCLLRIFSFVSPLISILTKSLAGLQAINLSGLICSGKEKISSQPREANQRTCQGLIKDFLTYQPRPSGSTFRSVSSQCRGTYSLRIGKEIDSGHVSRNGSRPSQSLATGLAGSPAAKNTNPCSSKSSMMLRVGTELEPIGIGENSASLPCFPRDIFRR